MFFSSAVPCVSFSLKEVGRGTQDSFISLEESLAKEEKGREKQTMRRRNRNVGNQTAASQSQLLTYFCVFCDLILIPFSGFILIFYTIWLHPHQKVSNSSFLSDIVAYSCFVCFCQLRPPVSNSNFDFYFLNTFCFVLFLKTRDFSSRGKRDPEKVQQVFLSSQVTLYPTHVFFLSLCFVFSLGLWFFKSKFDFKFLKRFCFVILLKTLELSSWGKLDPVKVQQGIPS